MLLLLVCILELVPCFMLPSPVEVIAAPVREFPVLLSRARVTLTEAVLGRAAAITAALFLATLMDRFPLLYKALYPLLAITQTIPSMVPPLLVLWVGFEMAPKITLVAITALFPMTIGLLLDGYASADKDAAELLCVMGASRVPISRHLKFPCALSHFFLGASGLRLLYRGRRRHLGMTGRF